MTHLWCDKYRNKSLYVLAHIVYSKTVRISIELFFQFRKKKILGVRIKAMSFFSLAKDECNLPTSSGDKICILFSAKRAKKKHIHNYALCFAAKQQKKYCW